MIVSCIGRVVRIWVGVTGVIATLLLSAVVTSLATRYVGKPLAMLWMLFEMATVAWYHLKRGGVLDGTAAQYIGRVLAPVALASAGWFAFQIGETSGARFVVAFLIALAILYVLVRYACVRASVVAVDAVAVHRPARTKRGATTLVMVEGNICASKTTLCRAAAEHADVEWRDEGLHRPLLRAFTQRPDEYGFTLQLVMRERRNAVLRYEAAVATKRYLFADRSVLGDWAFLVWNYINGSISDEQLAIYTTEYGATPAASLRDGTPGVAYAICLVCTPAAVCLQRLAQRPGVDQDTSLRYLLGVAMAHYMCAASLLLDPRLAGGCKIHLLDGTQRVDIGRLLAQLTRGRSPVPEIYDAPGDISFPDEAATRRYTTMCERLGIAALRPSGASERKWYEIVAKMAKENQ